MLWSSQSVGGYTIGVARSASGQLTGPWCKMPSPCTITMADTAWLLMTLMETSG
jgi:hypothetical protein